jgi:acetyl-CoA C-acetyltransferase
MDKNTPIIVGVHQLTQRWEENHLPKDPLSLMTIASQEAMKDTGAAIKASIDTVYVVNIFSYTYADAPGELSKVLEITPHTTIYPTEGGNTPQYLINQACVALEKGESTAILMTGSEVIYGFKQAQKQGIKLDWPKRVQPQNIIGEVRVPLNDVESAYELYLPVNIYPLFETALRAKAGRTPAEHQVYLGKLYEKFSEVAAQHPQAWTQEKYTAEDIYQVTDDNRYIVYPYTKRMNANINVDQASAIILTTVGEAEKLGIPPEKWVFPMGGANLNEVWEVTRRPTLYESVAIREAGKLALEQAGLGLSEIDGFDLYSCFPCAIQMGRDALGINKEDTRSLTLTGGLSYFGGPGNNYVSHSIITAVEQIRKNPSQKLMVTALGWYATKHAVGIYGKTPSTQKWADSQDFSKVQSQIDATELPPPAKEASGKLTVEAYMIMHGRSGQAEKGVVIGRLEDNSRTVAYLEADTQTLEKYKEIELIGKTGDVNYNPDKKRNWVKMNL